MGLQSTDQARRWQSIARGDDERWQNGMLCQVCAQPRAIDAGAHL